MDAHLFKRFCEALIPTLLGARVEKIHQPGPGVVVFTVYGFPHGPLRLPDAGAEPEALAKSWPHGGAASAHASRNIVGAAKYVASADVPAEASRKRYLVLKSDRKSPLLFVAGTRMAVNAHPPAPIMRLRKYLGDHRITAASCHWTERRLYLEVAADEAPVWLCLDLREGPSLLFEPPAPFTEPAWPDAELSPLALCEGEGWRDWPVISPALRRTLPYLDPEDGKALLMDLQTGGGDIFLYDNRNGKREASAWPLPAVQLSRMGADWRDSREVVRETVWEDALAALALTGETVYAAVADDARQAAARPFSAETKRLSRLLDKLDREEERLRGMCARQADALLLQARLYQFSPTEKRASVTLELSGEEPDGTAVRELKLDPRLTVRENMAALFHQAARGKRGLEHLARRRAVVRAEKEAAAQAMLRSEAALSGVGSSPEYSGKYSGGHSAGSSAAKILSQGGKDAVPAFRRLPSDLPKQVQAFRSSDGFLLLRGRDTRGNALALKLAAPHDFWLHTANGPSAHVVIRRDHAGQDVPERTLLEAGTLAALKSWLRDEEWAEIQYSIAKYIHPMKKAAPGMVRIDRSEGTFRVSLDPSLEEKLGAGG